jgi:hypothetical protein
MALGTMFITTQLTRWFAPMVYTTTIIVRAAQTHHFSFLMLWYYCFLQEYQIVDFDKSWATVGLKLACSWACGLIYLLFLLIPDRCCCLFFSPLMNSEDEPALDVHLRGSGGDIRSDGTFMTAATLLEHDLSAPRSLATTPATTQSFTHM